MILANTDRVGNPDDPISIASSDPRIVAFAALVASLDPPNIAGWCKASSDLKRLGFDVALADPQGQGVAG